MKSALLVILGVFMGVLAIFAYHSIFTDASRNISSAKTLNALKPLQKEIQEAMIQGDEKLSDELKMVAKLRKKKFFTFLKVFERGVIVSKGSKHGQVFVLTPNYSGGEVKWKCVGGSDRDVPSACR